MDSLADNIEFENIDITDEKYVLSPPYEHRRTLLMVTIADTEMQGVDIERVLEMGTNVIRFNTIYSPKQDKIKLIENFEKAASFLAQKYGLHAWPYATSVDLTASMVQTGLLEGNQGKILRIKDQVPQIWIEEKSEVILTNRMALFDKCNRSQIFVDNPYLTSDVKIGMEINISDAEIIMVCTAKGEHSIKCTVTKGGYLQNMAHVCMRGAIRTRPFVSKMDLHIIKFALEYQMDMIIINYPRNIETVSKIKTLLGSKQKRPLIITGISTQEGFGNIDDFIRETDGVLLSREYLTYEVEPALYDRIGWMQNIIAGKCRKAGKPFYVSGGIFEETLKTGIANTREISEVTNAILGGTTGFSLYDTSNMNNLFETIKNFNELCPSVEPLCTDKTEFYQFLSRTKMPLNAAEACALSCVEIANQTKARLIIVPTVSGGTVALITWFRPNSTILAVSTTTRTVRRLKTLRGVIPLLYKGEPRRTWFDIVQDRVNFALQYAVVKRWILFNHYYITLEKGSERSSFCDAVRVWKVTASKESQIQCELRKIYNSKTNKKEFKMCNFK
ncbi:unnamed protein product [Spodoptera littoralis]|uniref:Pyruvate kinase n=1 Tax=Spodoptera littoralis TaxID=7109 RepID=A0A9P0IGW6_SPOLI|nr:unnamed protein product [Spodoptera littoralis]CAH1647101.1 unnamed protein product [Spodoptera littoralis]